MTEFIATLIGFALGMCIDLIIVSGRRPRAVAGTQTA